MEELGIYKNAIYQHYKGDTYRVILIAYHKDDKEPIVVYEKCTESGVFKSIRYGDEIIDQPFYQGINEFRSNIQGVIKRFTFIKQL